MPRAHVTPATSRAPGPRRARAGAFTLLELVLVVAILAALAGLAVATYGGEGGGVEGQARLGLAGAEVATVQAAVARFHRDTGWLPGQGPFDLVGHGAAPSEGRVQLDTLPAFVAGTGQERAWLRHPANLWALLVDPLRDPATGALDHPLGAWDPVRRRGWSGPYLALASAGLCAVPEAPAGWDGRSPWDEAARPTLGAAGGPLPVYAIRDPFEAPPLGAGDAFAWFGLDFAPGAPASARRGRPYLLLEPGEVPTDPTDARRARVVSLGPDGRYGATFPAAIASPGSPLATDPTSDDVGRLVHR